MIALLREMWMGLPVLFWSTVYTTGLLVVSLVLMSVDPRLITGANAWLKPVKFGVSIVIYNLTIGWMLLRLEPPGMSARVIAWVVGGAMAVEITAIVVQAGRGVLSHYNTSTALNAAIFSAMAVAIVLNTLAIGGLCVLSFGEQGRMPAAVVWGVRLGLVLFLLSSLEGFQMVGNQGHTVGARDGGPGLPVLRWSRVAGDLRVAHFVGMHGIQVLPLLGSLLSRTERQAGVGVVVGVFGVLLGLFVWTWMQAWAGRPVVR